MKFRNKDDTIKSGTLLSIPIDVNCLKIDYLEHVQAFATIDTDERGLLEIALESPTGLYLVGFPASYLNFQLNFCI